MMIRMEKEAPYLFRKSDYHLKKIIFEEKKIPNNSNNLTSIYGVSHMQKAIHASNDPNFIYGVLSRPQATHSKIE